MDTDEGMMIVWICDKNIGLDWIENIVNMDLRRICETSCIEMKLQKLRNVRIFQT